MALVPLDPAAADLLRAVLSSQPHVSSFVLDHECRYVSYNRAHEHSLKARYGEQAVVGDSALLSERADLGPELARPRFERALAGESFVELDETGPGVVRRSSYAPLRNDAAEIIGLTCFVTDLTEDTSALEALSAEHRSRLEEMHEAHEAALAHAAVLEADLESRHQELLLHSSERLVLVEQLRLAVEELSTPVIEVWDGVLALPLVGVVDGARGARMIETVLAAVVDSQSHTVILDLTGVTSIDSVSIELVLRLAKAVALLGARCVLSGISPAIARTLVMLDVQLDLQTTRTLKDALEGCLHERDRF